MTIRVTKYTAKEKSGAWIGTLSICVSLYGKDFFINKIKLFQKNGQRWVNFPDEGYEVDGIKKYFPFCGFTERNDSFNANVIKAIDDFCMKQGPSVFSKPPLAARELPPEREEPPFEPEAPSDNLPF